MKKKILIFALLILSIHLMNGQNKNNKNLFASGKWYLEYMKMDDLKRQLPPQMKKEENWMIFHKDGKHEVMSFGKTSVGKWEYLENEKTLKLTENKKVSYMKVLKINEKELVFMYKYGKNELVTGLKKSLQ